MTSNTSKAKYGLKVEALYNASDFKSQDIVVKEAGQKIEKLVLSESGTYNISAYTNILITHDINLEYLHLSLRVINNNINVKIKATGVMQNIGADIYHQVTNEGEDNKCEILLDIIALQNTNLIYRSSINNTNESATTMAKSEAKIVNFDPSNRLAVEPAVMMKGDKSASTHSLSIRNINKDELEYMLLYGLNLESYQDILISNYKN